MKKGCTYIELDAVFNTDYEIKEKHLEDLTDHILNWCEANQAIVALSWELKKDEDYD